MAAAPNATNLSDVNHASLAPADEAEMRSKYAAMEVDERAVAMADDCVGDPWELLGYFREKLRQAEAHAEAAKDAAITLVNRLRDTKAAASSDASAAVKRDRPDDYRGWTIDYDYPAIPCRDFDFTATHPDFDKNRSQVWGRTWDAVRAEIDAWHEDNPA